MKAKKSVCFGLPEWKYMVCGVCRCRVAHTIAQANVEMLSSPPTENG